MWFKLVEDFDDQETFKEVSSKKIYSVAKDIASILLGVENPKKRTLDQLVDELKRHKDTFLEMIEQSEDLSEDSKEYLKSKINKLRL